MTGKIKVTFTNILFDENRRLYLDKWMALDNEDKRMLGYLLCKSPVFDLEEMKKSKIYGKMSDDKIQKAFDSVLEKNYITIQEEI